MLLTHSAVLIRHPDTSDVVDVNKSVSVVRVSVDQWPFLSSTTVERERTLYFSSNKRDLKAIKRFVPEAAHATAESGLGLATVDSDVKARWRYHFPDHPLKLAHSHYHRHSHRSPTRTAATLTQATPLSQQSLKLSKTKMTFTLLLTPTVYFSLDQNTNIFVRNDWESH